MVRRVGYVAVALLGFLGAAPGRPVRADTDETERRLKSAGVDDALRTRIHEAIDKGVAFLVKRQRKDGAFVDHWRPSADSPLAGDPSMSGSGNIEGVSLLCALALRHAGTAPTDAPVARAVTWLFEDDLARVDRVEEGVYEAGLALMLLAAVPGHEPEARRLAAALAFGLDETTAWWGYDTPGGGGDPTSPGRGFRASIPNLSTAQFGALGLWAARRMGIDVAPSVWARHAASLCDRQRRTGSWDYSDDAVRVQGAKGRPPSVVPDIEVTTNTYMGIANLLLCRQALVSAKSVDAKLLARVDAAITKARETLARNARATLENPRGRAFGVSFASSPGLLPPGLKLPSGIGGAGATGHAMAPGIGAYYTLYALEKACLFADVEAFDAVEPKPPDPVGKPGKKPGGAAKPAKPAGKAAPPPPKLAWYAAGATWLLAAQRSDGGWSPDAGDPPGDDPSEVETALALLFLLRSPSAFHPTTPSVVDARPRAVTPAEPGTPPTAPAPDPAAPAPPPEAPDKPGEPPDPTPSMGG